MSCNTLPLPAALSSAHQLIQRGQSRLDRAATDLVGRFDPAPAAGDTDSVLGDILELSAAAQQIEAGVAVAHTAQEASNELANMVRHDPQGRLARDTRPQPGLAHHTVDLLA
jgi:hypothetical protein